MQHKKTQLPVPRVCLDPLLHAVPFLGSVLGSVQSVNSAVCPGGGWRWGVVTVQCSAHANTVRVCEESLRQKMGKYRRREGD